MELTPAARAFLEEKRFAVLATVNRDGSPQQTVVWYELQGDQIMMNTKRGRRKDRNLVRTPIASICVEDRLRYVTISGSVELIDDQKIAQRDIERLATSYSGPESAARQVAAQFSKEERVTIRLRIDGVEVYGFAD